MANENQSAGDFTPGVYTNGHLVRVVETAADAVAAKFDGFRPPSPQEVSPDEVTPGGTAEDLAALTERTEVKPVEAGVVAQTKPVEQAQNKPSEPSVRAPRGR